MTKKIRVKDLKVGEWQKLWDRLSEKGYEIPCFEFREEMKKFDNLREFLLALPDHSKHLYLRAAREYFHFLNAGFWVPAQPWIHYKYQYFLTGTDKEDRGRGRILKRRGRFSNEEIDRLNKIIIERLD